MKSKKAVFIAGKAGILLAFSAVPVFSQQIADSAEAAESVKEEKSLFQANAQLAMSASDYQVTAGDTYAISFYSGGTSVSYTITVDSTYKIKIANLGSINCFGMTFIQLKQNIEALVTRNYPLGVVTFVMLQPSIFKVFVKGEVQTSREIQAYALTRLSDILGQANLTEFASTRNIRITSSKGKVKDCDLFKAKRDGDYSQNPYLRPGDVIEFSRMERKVSISGSVERGGTYELLDDENLAELISLYAHGATKTANLSKIRLVRVDDKDEKIRKIIYLPENEIAKNFKLADKDSVYISDWNEKQPFIEIKGIIRNPDNAAEISSAYNPESYNIYRTRIQFYAEENYSSLIRRIKHMFTVFSDLEKAYVQRGDKKIIIEAQKAIDDDSFESSVTVEKEDELVIPFKPIFEDGSDGLD